MSIAAAGRAGARAASHAGAVRCLTVAGLLGLLGLYLAILAGPDREYSVLVDGVLGNAVLGLPALACVVRALSGRAQRLPFLLIGAAAAAFTAGNVAYIAYVQFLDPVPYPSVADIGYLAPYPLLFTAVVLLAWPELRSISRGAFLDGVLGALACGIAGSIITVHPVIAALEGPAFVTVIGVIYPVADLCLTALIVGIVTLKAGRPGLTWVLLGSGVVTFAIADSVYLYRIADGTYQVGTMLDGLWAVGLTLMALGVTLPYRPGGRPSVRTQHLAVANAFSLVAVGMLVYGSLSGHKLPIYVVILATLTLLTAVRRVADGFSALRLLALSQRQARTDELTQLSNRRYFYEEVQRTLAQRQTGDRFGLVILDLDGFKAVNDTFGHHAGDELLRQIGPRLRAELNPGDALARLGGDEFAALLRGRDRETSIADAEKLRTAIARPFLIEGTVQSIAASVGVAQCPEDGVDVSVLMQRADSAMFDAKSSQLGVAGYDRSRHGLDRERINVYEALARHELEVHHQPQFSASTGQLIGTEALVRWRHPSRGLLMPDSFLPFFEQAGLMAELTFEVLELGARDHRRWRLDGVKIGLSVNVAPSVLLHDDLTGAILTILSRHGMSPSMLTVEITENVLLVDVERSLRTLHELRDEGFRLSLDDYGTGYCSLTYLRDLPLHEIKIDRSFVIDLAPNSADAAIVASTIDLARKLGLRTVVEGVEAPQALKMLQSMGCDVVQGYLLGRPCLAAELRQLPKPRSGKAVSAHGQNSHGGRVS